LLKGGGEEGMPEKLIKAVEIEGEISKIQTLADGGVRITLDLPEGCTEQAKVMLDWRKMLVKAVIQIQDERDTEKRRKIHI